MNWRLTGCILVLVLWLPNLASGQGGFDDVEIKSTRVADGLFMLEGRGGNIAVSIGDDGTLMIDDQYAPLSDKILAAIKKLGGQAPRFILNTHWHGDHTGGNEAFGRSGGVIIAHTKVRERLSTRQTLFGRTIEPLAKEGLPVVTYDDGLSIHFNDEEIRVFHLPGGHTDGDSVVVFTGSHVVHMGDLMFMGMFPFVDLDHGGDVEGLLKNVKIMLGRVREMESAKAGVKVIPGHGPLSSVGDLETYYRMLEETIGHVRQGIETGKPLDALRAAGVPERWESWGTGFIKTDAWIETIHKSLTRD